MANGETGENWEMPGADVLGEWTSCPTCGVRMKRKNLKWHVKNKHKKKPAKRKKDRREVGGGPRPGTKPGPRNPALANLSDDEMSSRVAAINRELKTLVPAFHGEKMAVLSREKRALTKELKARKASGLSRQWGRWYSGPGKVRYYRGGSGDP